MYIPEEEAYSEGASEKIGKPSVRETGVALSALFPLSDNWSRREIRRRVLFSIIDEWSKDSRIEIPRRSPVTSLSSLSPSLPPRT